MGFDEWEQQIGPTFELERDMLAMTYVVRGKLLSGEPINVMTKSGPVELPPDPDYLTRCLDRVSRSWERIVKQREGETIYVRLADRDVEALVRSMGEQLAEHVSDPAEAEAVMDGIVEAMRNVKSGGKGDEV